MKSRIKIFKYSVFLSACITILLNFYTILVLMGHKWLNFAAYFNIPSTEGDAPAFMIYTLLSIFVFLTLEFCITFRLLEKPVRHQKLAVIVSVFATAIVFGWAQTFLYYNVFDLHNSVPLAVYAANLGANFFLCLIVLLISYAAIMTKKQDAIMVENASLKVQNINSRYEALKNQMDPHFLFNSFSSLTSMIEIDPLKAQDFSMKMSSVMRYTLQHKDLVTVAEEIAFAKDYCSLMQIRYDKNLTVSFEIDKGYERYLLVPLSVQTLLENAIKHNEISNRSPLEIRVYTAPDDTLTVSNNRNTKRDDSSGTGVGLSNLAERYMLRWNKKISIHADDYAFMVTLPLIPSENE